MDHGSKSVLANSLQDTAIPSRKRLVAWLKASSTAKKQKTKKITKKGWWAGSRCSP
jgi:hypothetical protein